MTERFANIVEFYDKRGGKLSGEVDFGVWWWEENKNVAHRVSWVADTGDVYAVNQVKGTVELLGKTAPCTHGYHPIGKPIDCAGRAESERLLDGWAEECGKPDSLAWARERMAGAPA